MNSTSPSFQVGEDRREVAGPLERGARRDVQLGADLGRDDVGQRGLAQPGRAGEEHVVGGCPRLRAAPRMTPGAP